MNNETIIQNADITNIRITDGAYRCYILLQSMAYGQKDFCFPSQHYLAVSLGRSIRTIQRYLKELVKAELILIKRRGSISNIYTILAKKANQVGGKVAEAIKSAYNASKAKRKVTGSNSTFNDFKQREYNWNSLEDMLLGRKEYDSNELYSSNNT